MPIPLSERPGFKRYKAEKKKRAKSVSNAKYRQKKAKKKKQ